jgi:hypothetical protein
VKNGFVRVTRNEPCPVCGHSDWCLRKLDGRAAICQRIESQKLIQRHGRDQAGWLHSFDDGRDFYRPVRPVAIVHHEPIVRVDWSALAAECERRFVREGLVLLANSLGISTDSLKRLSVGWHRATGCYAFPMRDDAGVVIGIRLRRPKGFKFAVSGSSSGLFIPHDLAGTFQHNGALYIAEGPTDCGALLDMGFSAVGRPSCLGGVPLLTNLVKRLKPSQVVIVADGDEPGQNGARRLAESLSEFSLRLRVITPPAKDVREWKRQGATAADIVAAPAVRFPHPAIRRARQHAIAHRRSVRTTA